LDSPIEQGFDAFFGQIDQSDCHNMYPRQIDQGTGRNNVNFTGNWDKKSRDICMANPEKFNFTIDAFHDAGMAWLESAAKGPKPFFMYLSFTVPHAGGWGDHPENPEQGAPVPTDLQYKDKSWPDVEKDHAAVITYLDDKVGDLMARLSALGVDKNTLVIFASDNGAHIEGGHKKQFFNSTGGLQGNKRSLFEGGYRSPTMARWPAVIEAGRVSSFPWAFWDMMPTFAELSRTQSFPEGLDGISIVPELKGEKQPDHEYLFWTWVGAKKNAEGGRAPTDSLHYKNWEDYNMLEDPEAAGKGYAVRVGNFKGIVQRCNPNTLKPGKDDVMAIYDVVNDPFETTDVSAKHADLVAKFKKIVISKDLTCQCYQCR
jgi:arylsulfatase A-like enzyme